MKYLIIILILLIIGLIGLIIYCKYKVEGFLKKFFNTSSLKEAINQSEVLASETPKSISSMENVLKNKIKEDFPELNLNEIKRLSESVILDSLSMIENHKNENKYSIKVNAWIDSKIKENKDIHFDSIKFHKTTVCSYEKKHAIATLYVGSSLEYYTTINGVRKKVQDRFKTEFIYIIDEDKVDKEIKAIGLNCPNCGASIKSVGNKTCVYCGSGVKDIVKRTWSINNIDEY